MATHQIPPPPPQPTQTSTSKKINPLTPTYWDGELRGGRQLPQLSVSRQLVDVGVVHLQQDVLRLDVCVDNLAFRVQVI